MAQSTSADSGASPVWLNLRVIGIPRSRRKRVPCGAAAGTAASGRHGAGTKPAILRQTHPVLRILDRYLLRELVLSFLAVGAVLLLISIGETVVAVLNQVTRGKVPADLLFTLIALRSVDGLNVLLPLAVFLGVLLAYGRLYRDSEMAVLSAGLDVRGLLRPLAMLAVPLMLVLALVSLWRGI